MRRGGGKGNVFLKLSQMDCAVTNRHAEGMHV